MPDAVAGNESPADLKALLATRLRPGESLVWAGRPRPGRIARDAIPRALAGLGVTAFVIIWITMVARGGGNWNKGKAVPPYAPHDLLIAAGAGLWFLPPSLFLLTSPLRVWWKARRTLYALTDRRALILSPDYFGRVKVRDYLNDSLGLSTVDERADGSGNLTFASRKTLIGTGESVGFLAVDRVRSVEALLRKTASLIGDTEPAPDSPRTYELAPPFRAAIPVYLAMFSGQIVIAILCRRREWHITPVTITLGDDRTVEFRSSFHALTVPVSDIISVRTGGWRDPNRLIALLEHKGGRIHLLNHFQDFREFLLRLKALNPAVDIRGF